MEEVMNIVLDLPVICTRGIIVFPEHEISLDVGRRSSLNALDKGANEYDENIILVSQIDPSGDHMDYDSLYHHGTLCKIKRRIKKDNRGTIKLTVRGISRVEIMDVYDKEDTLFAKAKCLNDITGDPHEEKALVRKLHSQFQLMSKRGFPREVLTNFAVETNPSYLADTVAQYIQVELHTRQNILSENDINKRLLLVIASMMEEKAINEIEQKIDLRIKESIDENQKEYYLREKMRAIKQELGDAPSKEDDTDWIREELKKHPYPQHIVDKLEEELHRYDMTPSGSQEGNVIRTYIDWMMKIPWYQETEDQSDINEVERILEEDHYGLEKPKERIVEHLAVKQMTQSLNAPIICLVGPPGTGKTSLAKSIARALNRKFVKASLGGVRDEAEIRGHRRTYLGSMPGRIIQGMKRAGVVNPVFLLDEIDKMSSDYRGDPTSAMLEVLDPEQNSMFSDNYVEEPYDLSKVLFIATANDLGNIPEPLRDRLEIIELSSYTEQEKLEIAKRHLVPKELKIHGINDEQFKLEEDAIMYIIRHYTREAGVRELERYIAKLCRKVVLEILKENKESVTIGVDDLVTYLGKAPYDHTKMLDNPQIGVVTGLAWTQFGGDILSIEANHFKGSGHSIITGQLGDVMKESASIALDYIKANSEKYGLKDFDFDKQDVHIHVPEGAVKKDGPSAGVTLTTAILSSFKNQPVRNDVAMTGEITLRGEVLPIGGLKEKSISAHRSGIKTIIIPKDNEKDIDEIPQSVQDELNIILADNIDTVLENAFLK